jgi:hypothetical protein
MPFYHKKHFKFKLAMKKKTLLLLTGLFCMTTSFAQETNSDALYNTFLNPPQSVYPRVWWHWMNGNITKDGIRKDLLWMKRSGIGGFHFFDAGLKTPQIVKNRLIYMTPEWKDAFHYAIALGDSLGMEMTIASSPGWSETGGPWVQPKDGMKRFEWRAMDVTGGKKLNVKLPDGYENYGSFLNSVYAYNKVDSVYLTKKFYRDLAVLAVKLPDGYKSLAEMNPVITTSGGNLTLEQLANDDIMDYSVIKADKSGYCWVQFEFPQPQTIRSFTFSEARKDYKIQNITRDVLKSDDGKTFTPVDSIVYQANIVRSHNIPATTAKFFRVRFKNDIRNESRNISISMLIPSAENVVEAFGDKGGYTHYRLLNNYPTPKADNASAMKDVVDVTKYVKNGVLSWKAPAGKWRILRLGYGLTGKTNHPASPEATGLEVDKMNPTAIKEYYKNFLQTYINASQGLIGKKGITYMLNDSYEAGPQTWTDNMFKEFKKRRGYDLLKWLPALTGMIINSSEETDRFLFDWRTTIGDMITEYHYDAENEILKPYNLKRYTESHEHYRANLTDGMDCKRYADIPMSATWVHYKQGMTQNPNEEADIRESASVAHIYGQNIAAAESFTAQGFSSGAFVYDPENLKRTADFMMGAGLNLFVVHESAHQPVDDKVPGLGLEIFGQWFNRHETWAELASAWTKYLSRSCYLLRQGRFAADLAVYYGEDANLAGVYDKKWPDIPAGYNFDFVNKSVLNDVVKIENGALVTPTGMNYKALILVNNDYMSLPVLRRIGQIADAGVQVFGDKPTRKANLSGDKAEFDRLVDHIWNSGKTNVKTGFPSAEDLETSGIKPDVEWLPASKDIRFVHRTLPQGEIYWLSNVNDAYRTIDFSFKVTGKKPVIWHPETGETEPAEYLMQGDRTSVKVNMVPHDALFVMFTEPTSEKSGTLKNTFEAQVAKIETPWKVAFQENRGAPAATTMTRLASYTDSKDFGIKYFSGTAVYTTTFNWNGEQSDKKAGKYFLDLGEVHDLADVTLNGRPLGILWHTPFKVDVTDVLQKGENTLQVKVVNVWHNRMVGDVQPGVKDKVTYYPVTFFKADEKLLPAGMMGAVSIIGEY